MDFTSLPDFDDSFAFLRDPTFDTPFTSDSFSFFEPNVAAQQSILPYPSPLLEHDGDLAPQTPASTNSKDRQGLLSFHVHMSSRRAVLDSTRNPQFIDVAAQLSGMFFIAESLCDESTPASDAELPTLTCYRRNLFKVAGTISLPRSITGVLSPRGHEETVDSISVELSATESLEETPAKIVVVPTKNTSNSSSALDIEPLPIKVDSTHNPNDQSDPYAFTFSWDRLQFRNATAKNNRRAALQQHYVVKTQVMATLKDFSKILLCEAISTPVIVRGRSPGSYQTSKPATEVLAPRVPRKTFAQPVPASGKEQQVPQDILEPTKGPLTLPSAGTQQRAHPLQLQNRSAEADFGSLFAAEPMSLLVPDDTFPNLSSSLSNESYGISSGHTDNKSPDVFYSPQDGSMGRSASITQPEENENLLQDSTLSYEYFPLSIDDWMAPVQAVYRPHGVHHKKPARKERANFKKRYYIDT